MIGTLTRAIAALLRLGFGLTMLGLLLVGGFVAGFFGSLRGYEQVAPPPPAHTTPSTPTPDLSREALDALLEGEAPPVAADAPPAPEGAPTAAEPPPPAAEAEPPDPAPSAEAAPSEKLSPVDARARAVAAVRLHRPIEAATLRALDCAALDVVRGWLWAERRYAFTSEAGKALFATQSGYQPDPSATLEAIEEEMTDVDRANRNLLTAALRTQSCSCASAGPAEPCPR